MIQRFKRTGSSKKKTWNNTPPTPPPPHKKKNKLKWFMQHLGILIDCLLNCSKLVKMFLQVTFFLQVTSKYYALYVTSKKNFNRLLYNKPYFDQPVKKSKKPMKNLRKCQEMMIIQQGINDYLYHQNYYKLIDLD